jgi:hypothetical protein
MAGFIVVLLLAQIGAHPKVSPLARLQAKVRVGSVQNFTAAYLAGNYSHPSKEFRPGLSGNDLYLFADGTYIYGEWSDIEPLVIRDEGTWNVAEGSVVLKSDTEVTWDPDVERKYVAVRRQSRPNEILLIGTGRDISYFEENSKDGPETELMVVCKERSKNIPHRRISALKEKLMHESWRPEYFRAGSR